MTIAEQIQVAADYDTWKREQARLGRPISVEDYERHLRAERYEVRLEQISVIAQGVAVDQAPREDFVAALRQIAALSDPNEETQ